MVKIIKDSEILLIPEKEWGAVLARSVMDSKAQIRRGVVRTVSASTNDHVAGIVKAVGNHFHIREEETYKVVSGMGRLHYGPVTINPDGWHEVFYQEPIDVAPGDTFIIPERYAHQLQNTGNGELVILFRCPDDHFEDSNRVFLPDAPSLL